MTIEIFGGFSSISPLSDTGGLYRETDRFRKGYNDSIFYQLNIYSQVTGDTAATREELLFFYKHNSRLESALTDQQIDSVAGSWGLKYLDRRP